MKTILALLALLLLTTVPAHSRDGYADNGRPLVCSPLDYEGDAKGLAACSAWISGVHQPKSKTACCGEGDAYIADDWEQGPDGGWVAIITRDYPAWQADDGEGSSVTIPAVPKGTRIPVPKGRIDDEHQGNPTGHGVIFMNSWTGKTGNVLCYFTKVLI